MSGMAPTATVERPAQSGEKAAAAQPRALRVPAEEVESIRQKLAAPKKPGARLRAAATKRKR